MLDPLVVCKAAAEVSAQEAEGGLYPAVDEEHDVPHFELFWQEWKLAHKNATWLRVRRLILSAAFLAYVGTSVGIPLWKRRTVSCSAGFFWEDHAIFFGVFAVTKLLELALYTFDPTVTGNMDIVPFMIRFAPSFLGYADGYIDATAITIASACGTPFGEKLASWMFFTYLVGVVLAQWVFLAALVQTDGTQACFMKLAHMDALAASVTIESDKKRIWKLVNLTRTFAEDLPQAVLQALFCLCVRGNYWMIFSVTVLLRPSRRSMIPCVMMGSPSGQPVLDKCPEMSIPCSEMMECQAGTSLPSLRPGRRSEHLQAGQRHLTRSQ